MTGFKRTFLVVLGIVALVVPAGAIAKQDGNHGKGKAKGHGPHKVAYLFKGFYAGEGSLEVKRGNSRVRKGGFIGETVSFDLSGARIVVRDTNEDGKRNLEDVVAGEWVLVKARLPRKDPGSQPFDAKRLIDKTNHPGKGKSPKSNKNKS
jgi:hypothetical protein